QSASSVPGPYFIIVAADQDNAISELDESNNLRAAPVTLSLPPMPDFRIVNVLAPANALPGQEILLSWTVTNQGSLTITGALSETISLATNAAGAGAQELAT